MGTHPRRRYHGQIIDIEQHRARLPDGRVMDVEVARHPGGVAVVALDTAGRLCLLHQYRPVLGEWLWELPAGRREPGEDALTTARRELEEEAGLQAGDWRRLGAILTSPGFCDEVIELFAARGLTTVPARPEGHEYIEIHWLPVAEALAWAGSGRIRDAKTLVGLWRAIGASAEE